ncbi:hypothetical protein RTE01_27440 [Raoultella terrigena]|nr:hypothetical protein RTE01_27440 [Raoultella terrigena]
MVCRAGHSKKLGDEARDAIARLYDPLRRFARRQIGRRGIHGATNERLLQAALDRNVALATSRLTAHYWKTMGIEPENEALG